MYPGNEDATEERVRRYLKDNYTEEDGVALSDARLTELVTDHRSIVDEGIRLTSYAYYVGDRIAQTAGLELADTEQDEDEDEDEDEQD